MIHPSYVELMKVVNKESDNIGEMPVVNSRYSIVIASAKRARQIVDGAEPKVEVKGKQKPLSIAVDEIYNEKVHILADNEMTDVDMDMDVDMEIDIGVEIDIDRETDADIYEEADAETDETDADAAIEQED